MRSKRRPLLKEISGCCKERVHTILSMSFFIESKGILGLVFVFICLIHSRKQASLVAQLVKNLLAMQETWAGSLGWEDSLKKEMATHTTFLSREKLMDREVWCATVHGVARVWHDLENKPPPPLHENSLFLAWRSWELGIFLSFKTILTMINSLFEVGL